MTKKMTSIYYYTLTVRGKQYRVCSPVYGLRRTALYIHVPEKSLTAGANSELPNWDGKTGRINA